MAIDTKVKRQNTICEGALVFSLIVMGAPVVGVAFFAVLNMNLFR